METENAGVDAWNLLENTKYFQDLAGRYFQEDYQGQRGYSDMGQLLRAAHRAGLVRDKLGLDLGCGNGRPGLFIVRRNRCNLVGLDAASAALQIGRERADRYALADKVSFVLGRPDARTLPFADGVFDGVISTEGFGPVEDFAAVYREVWRVLKPGGGFAFFYITYTDAAIEQEPPDQQPSLRQGQANQIALLEQAGFSKVKAFDVTGELEALVARMKRAYEERGVMSKLRDSFGPALADQLYTEIIRLYGHLENNQVQRQFFSAKKDE